MSAGFEYRSNLKGCEAELQKLWEAQIVKVAHQVEGQTKRNIQSNGQIDTGFMVSSVYAVTQDGSSYDATNPDDEYVNRAGRLVERNKGLEAGLKGADAAVAVGAEYAIWQELQESFLFRALEQVGARFG